MAFPDYYDILGIAPASTAAEIKAAYYARSLETHPDRFPSSTPNERSVKTSLFQAVSDAYYTLSDPERRTNYDRLRSQQSSRTSDSSASSSYFNFFSKAGGAAAAQPDPDVVFTTAFEDLLRAENGRGGFGLYKYVGGAGGAALGFIVGSIPGALLGMAGGAKLGQIRDAKGKALAEVFKDLGSDQKAALLQSLAAKVFGMVNGRVS